MVNMMSSSAFMRGEGTPAAVRRSTAAFRDWRSCTSLFHHGDLEARRKTNDRKIEESLRVHSCFRAGSCRALLGLDGRGRPSPHTTTTSHHPSRLLLHLLRLIVRDQGVDNRLQFAVHHLL